MVFSKYSMEDNNWIFFSYFDPNWVLTFSKWVLYSWLNMWALLNNLYSEFIENKNLAWWRLYVDIVLEYSKIENIEDMKKIDLSKEWLLLFEPDTGSIGILLKATKWVDNIGQALKVIKEKNNLKWNVDIYSIQSDRLEVIL